MTTVTASWQLRRNAAKSGFSTALLVSTAVCAFLAQSICRTGSSQIDFYLLLVAALYVGSCLFVVVRYFNNKKSEQAIRVHDGILTIPRCGLKAHLIPLREIKSAETYPVAKKPTAVLVGRFNKSAIMVVRQNFRARDEFDAFVQFLNHSALANQSTENAEDIAAVTARRASKSPSLTLYIALTCVVTYAASGAAGIDGISERALVLGGLTKETLPANEFFRFASSFFLHLTPWHLLLNLLFLGLVGRYAEVILGRVRFTLILFCSATSGSLMSLALSSADTVVGASGGLFGIFGAYFIACIKYHRQLPGSVSVSGKTLSVVLALQFLSDVTNENVDICSHIGGFLFGMLYASLILRGRTAGEAATFSRTELLVAAIMATAYASGLLYFLSRQFEVL